MKDQKCPLAALLDDAMLELLDMANDGRTLDIRFVPRKHGGESSYLMWKPIDGEGTEELAIREHVPDADPAEVRQVWLLGDPVRELRDFLPANKENSHP